MLQDKQVKKHIDQDERGNSLMTLRTIKYFCSKENLFQTPDLNEKLYLQYKGFKNIDALENYPNLVALWLNNNTISKIQGLNSLKNLTCLYLQYNSISKIQNLDCLQQLSVLSLAHNKLQKIQGLSALINLNSLNISENFLNYAESLSGLLQCPSLTSVDLSKNQIQNSEEIFSIMSKNVNISCLYLKSTPLSRGFKNYRKRFIASLKKLKFLDDRPVQQIDHRLSQAWVKGGPEQQKEERLIIAYEKEEKNKKQNSQFNTKLDIYALREEERQNLQHIKSVLQNQQPTQEKMEELSKTKQRIEYLKEGPKGFQAKVTDTTIKVFNANNDEEERQIIDKYFSVQKKEIQENLKKIQEKEQAQKGIVEDSNEEKIAKKVKEMLDINEKEEDQYLNYWKKEYQTLLEALLEKYKFDFAEVQPSFNMIMAEINKKMGRFNRRFEISELRKIWTKIEIQKRKDLKV